MSTESISLFGGLPLMRYQRKEEPLTLRGGGRYVQLKITNDQGRSIVHAVSVRAAQPRLGFARKG